MKNALARSAAVLGLLAFSATASAQAIEASIDCQGDWAAGDTVPYGVRLEEQALLDHLLHIQIEVLPFGMEQPVVLVEKDLMLPANTDKQGVLSLKLPKIAPGGEYTMSIVASEGAAMYRDTCSFHVL